MVEAGRLNLGEVGEELTDGLHPCAGDTALSDNVVQQVLCLNNKDRPCQQRPHHRTAHHNGSGAIGKARGAGVDIPPAEAGGLGDAPQMEVKAVGRLPGETPEKGTLILWRAVLVEERALLIQQTAADGGGDGEGIHHLLGDVQIKGQGGGIGSHGGASVVNFCVFSVPHLLPRVKGNGAIL